LGVPPEFIIVKNTDDTNNWNVYHKDIGNTHGLYLDLNNAKGDDASLWNDTSPTNAVFSLGNGNGTNNASSHEYMAYCWTPIPGYSAFGTYVGTGSAKNFIYLGFKPRYFMLKPIDATDDWRIFDTARNTINPVNTQLKPNENSAEASDATLAIDFLSNGVGLQASLNSGINGSGTNFMYAAFAEHPFKLARAA